MKRQNLKKPNFFVYKIGKILGKMYSKFFLNLKIETNETKGAKGSYVVIANHEASIDFLPLISALPRKTFFVVSNAYYQTSPIKKLLDWCRVIPKQQFNTRVSDMKKMKSVVSKGHPLALYPAGLMTGNGISTVIPEATGKTLKWFGCDIYAAVIKGTYLSHPKWSKVNRKGKVTLSIVKLFSSDEIKLLSEKIIMHKINETLKYDSYENQKTMLIPYKNGNNIIGLESVLYKCPKCNEEFFIESTSFDTLTCTKCNNQVKANEYGLLEKIKSTDIIFDTPSEWSKYIIEDIKNNLKEYLESYCEVQMINYSNRKFEFVGNGKIKLEKDKFVLKGTIKNKEIKKEFLVSKFPTLPYKPGICFDLQEENEIYRIYLENPKHTIKWVYYTEILYKMNL